MLVIKTKVLSGGSAMVLEYVARCVLNVRLIRAANRRTVIPGASLGLAIGYSSGSRKAALQGTLQRTSIYSPALEVFFFQSLTATVFFLIFCIFDGHSVALLMNVQM